MSTSEGKTNYFPPQNYDLKTVQKVVTTAVATVGIGVVPTGMHRYITFVSMNNIAPQQNTIYLCSAINSANTSTVALASAAQKYSRKLEVAQTVDLPPGGLKQTNPLFSIAAGAYLNMRTDKGSMRVFVQYFDQPP